MIEILICSICEEPFETVKMYDPHTDRIYNEGAHNSSPLAEGLCCRVCNPKVLEHRIARGIW